MLNLLTHKTRLDKYWRDQPLYCMILKPNQLEPEIDHNVILKFRLIISLVYNKDTDIVIEAPVRASVSHALSCLVL